MLPFHGARSRQNADGRRSEVSRYAPGRIKRERSAHAVTTCRDASMTTNLTDFFISYATADEAWAVWIATQLEDAGFSTYLQALDFRPGQNFVSKMAEGLDARHTIAVITQTYLERQMPEAEWTAAFASDPVGARRTLIPVLVESCTIPRLLATRIYIDLTVAATDEEATRILLDGVAPGRAPRHSAPPFPQANPHNTSHINSPGHSLIRNVVRNEISDRRDELTTLARIAGPTAHHEREPRRAVIVGDSGLGKSALAENYAASMSNDLKVAWRVHGNSLLSLVQGLTELSRALQLPQPNGSSLSAVAALFDWLKRNDHWLIVIDGADQPDEIIPLLPTGPGTLLVTSQNPAWDGWEVLPLKPLSSQDSVVLLSQRAPAIVDPDGARTLATALGGHPLALVLAAATCVAKGMTFSAYLRDLEKGGVQGGHP